MLNYSIDIFELILGYYRAYYFRHMLFRYTSKEELKNYSDKELLKILENSCSEEINKMKSGGIHLGCVFGHTEN